MKRKRDDSWVTLYAALLWALGLWGNPVRGQVLNPPYFNLAEGRRILATATCGVGVSEPELYCKLVGAHADQKDNPNVNLIQGQVCDYCDPNNPELAHPPEYAIDGSERWWQSPPLSRGVKYNEVNLTIDLGQEFHVAYVFIKMANSPRPGVWVLERSQNLGETWEPWQYFADTPSDCINFFGSHSLGPISADDTVICETKFSKVVPLEGGEIVVSLLNDRPSANDFYNSTVLQEWTKATNIRLRFLRAKTLLGHLMSVARQDPTVTRRYFYSIRDINVGGRCVCNGHADLCDITDPNDVYKLLCRCQHNTCGSQCETCCPGFVQKKWRRATLQNLNECEPCNCFGHSTECVYDEETDRLGLSLDARGHYDGGGVCQNCQHNTEGVNCNRCKAGYYRPYGRPLNATNVCEPCVCDPQFSTGSCAEETGQCECRPEFLPPYCSSCNLGYYGYPNCRPCDCHLNGTRGTICEVGGGQCPCKPNYTGKNCDRCARDFYGFPDCLPCDCNPTGSTESTCDVLEGQCRCRSNFGGRTCGECADGFYNYPKCTFCNCHQDGTESSICEKTTGACICKPENTGPHCANCAPGYYGYPDCRKCECNQFGSIDNECDENGKCRCGINFAGHLCDQCSPGYYRYPECIACHCDAAGSIGLTCDDDGRCQCKPNFDGNTCNICKQGYYNYPLCEECNCNPAGVASTFAGCDSQSPGELCNCKERVTGRICNQCRPLYWNLDAANALGCEDCNCHLPGTIGGIGVCDEVTGQCLCKTNVGSRQCHQCRDGFYNLREDDLFGCVDCGCNVGGAVNNVCDRRTGQCVCRPRITGQTCDRPIQLHYFPTLFQHRLEAEDGHTPAQTPVRFGYDELDFPGYSWRGYAVFSQIQREILLNVAVDKPSLYRIVLRYANTGSEPISGSVVLTPETSAYTQQTGNVKFEPTESPRFGMATGSDVATGLGPASFVLDPGRWTMTIKGEKNLLLDYVVLLPSAYYEATILQEHVDVPCTLGHSDGKCYHFKFPDLEGHPTVKAESGYTAVDDQRQKVETYAVEEVLQELGVGPMAILNGDHSQMLVELTLPKPGRYVLVLLYHTPEGGALSSATIETLTTNGQEKGRAILYACGHSVLCRQVVTDLRGKVSVFHFDANQVTLDVKGAVGGEENLVTIDSVVAIPARQWHTDYVRPSFACIRQDGKCLEGRFQVIPGSIKVEAEADNEDQKAQELPGELFDDSIVLVYLDHKDAMVDIRGRVPVAGDYVFVVHYFQTKHPEFDLDVLIQNGQFYEGTLPVPFCPSVSGCRAVIRAKDGSTHFKILENFMVTLREPNHKSVWIDYLLTIPVDAYHDDVLQPQPLDRTVEFLADCGKDHFYLDPKVEGFCRNATFALTSEYNNGGLPCECDFRGSMSFECDTFGGQCPCRPNIIGRKCSECRTGFYGFPTCRPCNCPSTAVCHPTTGECICPPRVTGEKCDRCIANTYGYDPIIGCEECHCNPLGVRRGRLQCDLQTGECDCKPNVVTRTCDRCQAGYWNFPRCQLCECDLRGAAPEICDPSSAQCFCKDNVFGRQCDQCQLGTFNLEEKNPAGCTKCFCFGRTDRCSSSILWWKQIQDATGPYEAAALLLTSFGVQEHEVTSYRPNVLEVLGGDVVLTMPFSTSPDVVYFFVASDAFLGNKVTSYGGKFRYTIEVITRKSDVGTALLNADVILLGNNITVIYEHDEQAVDGIPLTIEVDLREWNFRHWSGGAVTREQLMTLLLSLDKIYLRAQYNTETSEARLRQVSMDVAVSNYSFGASQAHAVEQCHCPPNYEGTSCEFCAPGYYRTKTGPYGGYCTPCQCHDHADTCDPVTGVCLNCKHNTVGEHCDKCDVGFHGDATTGSPNDCLICACPLPYASNNFATSCELSPNGKEIRCECRPGYTGARCDYCAAGYYGQPVVIGDYCKPCMCSGNIDTNSIESCDSVTGACLRCLNNTSGAACELCAPGYYGDAVESKNCRQCFCDECGTRQCDHVSGRCRCQPNVIGDKCEECAPGFWGFDSCEGCIPCNCSLASQSQQCDVNTGQCRCQAGVGGRTCDRCLAGYWNYGLSGCQACRCNEDYSIGGTCNPQSGRCECLPGVVGDRCDRCPHRWVLIDNVGCHECDPCVHTLLDDLDALHATYDPVWASLEGVAFIYFAYQRLATVNESAVELRPKVEALIRDPTLVDLGPLEESVANAEEKAKTLTQEVEQSGERANETSVQADETRMAALKAEAMIKEAIAEVQGIVKAIQQVASGLEERQVPDLDRILAEAEAMLKEILDRDFATPKVKAEDELQAAKDILERAKQFVLPALRNAERVDALGKLLDNLNDRLRDLMNHSANADSVSLEADRLNKKNENPPAVAKIRRILTTKEGIDTALEEGGRLIEEAKALLEEAKDNFADLEANDDRLKGLIDRLRDFVKDLDDGLKDVVLEVRQAVGHAKKLMDLAAVLNDLLADTRESAENAVRAANSYRNIVDAIREAHEAAKQAVDAAQNASIESQGLDSEAANSLVISKDLMEEALATRERVEGDLRERLGLAKDGVDGVGKMNRMTRVGLDELNRAMDRLPGRDLSPEAARAKAISEDANGKAQQALDKVQAISERLPDDKVKADQIPKDVADANRDIKRGLGQVERALGILPELKDSLTRLGVKQSAIRVVGTDVREKIEALKRKIALARDQANRIVVGLTFYPNTTLQLRNPEGLHRSTTSTKMSLYFKTKESNGFLTYLGSPIGTRLRMKRALTDDYMALEVQRGQVALTMDLGSGPKKVVNPAFVSDDQWHQVLVDRIGRTVTLTVRTELEDKVDVIQEENTLPGPFSVFNLDQEHSKFYVGGFPHDVHIQTEVINSNFSGLMERLMFDEKPVGLWNFVKGANNTDGSVERDKLVVLTQTNGVQLDGTGYVTLQRVRQRFANDIEIIFRFKTFADDGLLFLVGKGAKYYSVELRDGKVVNQIKLRDRPVEIVFEGTFNDGQWHTVESKRIREDMRLKVDGKDPITVKIPGGRSEELEFTDDIFVGGHPHNHAFEGVTNVDFEGCIDNLQIGATLHDLKHNKEALGAVPGCPVKILSSATFAENSTGYVAMANTNDLGAMPQLTFRFKTTHPNGILFYTANRDQTNYLSVSLAEGILSLRARPGGDVQTSSAVRYADGEWHYVSASKNDTFLQLFVDDFETFDKRATNYGPVDSERPFYFGGVPADLTLTTGATPTSAPFVGCIGDATINGFFQNFADSRDRPGAALVSCPLGEPEPSPAPPPTAPVDQSIVTFAPPRVTPSPTPRQTRPPWTPPPPTTPPPTTTEKPVHEGPCKLPLRPRSDPELSELNGVRYGHGYHSHEEYDVQTPQLRLANNITLEFRTMSTDGVLFYLVDKSYNDVLAGFLKDGQVNYVFNLGSGRVSIQSRRTYSDDKWHKASFVRRNVDGTLIVDGDSVSGRSPGSLSTMDVVSPLYVGGVRESISAQVIKSHLKGVDVSFPGCIRRIHFEGQPLGKPKKREMVGPCSDKTELGAFIGADGGYLIPYDRFRVGLKRTISMEIKPRNTSGVLLAVHNKKDFLALQLLDGSMEFSVDNGVGIISTVFHPPSPSYFCDGEWHHILALKSKNVVTLSVDGISTEPGIGLAGVSSTDTNKPLHIGGMPSPEGANGIKTTARYVGCIRNLVVDSKPSPLNMAKVVGSVSSSSCPTD